MAADNQIPRDTSQEYAASRTNLFCYDMSSAPRGKLIIILTHPGGKALVGMVSGDPRKDRDICGWRELPGRDRDEEVRLGLFSHAYKYNPEKS